MKASSTIVYKPVNVSTDPLIDKIETTYISSFPESERRAFALVREMVDKHPYFRMYAILKENVYAGFITIWVFDDFVYVEHFAIDESARNGGIGSIALKECIQMTQLPIVLEVEVPTDDLSKRRIGFYERHGFTLNTQEYRQPPYRKGGDWLDMLLMNTGAIELIPSFDAIKKTLYKHVYNVD